MFFLRSIETFNLWLTDIPLCCFSDANSRKQEVEWKEKAKLELEEWHTRQNEQLEKTKVNNRYTTLFEQLKSRSEAVLSFAVWLQKHYKVHCSSIMLDDKVYTGSQCMQK